MSRYVFPSDLNLLKDMMDEVLMDIRAHGINESDFSDVKLCFEEGFVNAIKHGNRSNPDLQVTVEVVFDPSFVQIFIQDEGNGFDFDNCPDPTLEENLCKTSGRGVFFIKKFMDEAGYNNHTKCLMMRKYYKSNEGGVDGN